MQLRVWRSFSSNNSTDYRLVARFASATLAEEVAEELRAVFEEILAHDLTAGPTPRQLALAARYGFTWPAGPLAETYNDDGFSAAAYDGTLVVHHNYCLGGLEVLAPFLRARGGEPTAEAPRSPTVTTRFRLPDDAGEAERLYGALEAHLGLGDHARAPHEQRIAPWLVQRPEARARGLSFGAASEAVLFRIGAAVGLHLPIDALEVDTFRRFLLDAGVRDFRFTLCDDSQLEALQTLARVGDCPACGRTPVELHEAAIEGDLSEDQIACRGCGAMFSLDALETLQPVARLGAWDVAALGCAGETVYALTQAFGLYADVWRCDGRLATGFERVIEHREGALEHLLVLSAQRLLACGSPRHLVLSTDGGKSWREPRGKQRRRGKQALHRLVRGHGGWVFAVGDEGLILGSRDDGATFFELRRTGDALRDLVHRANGDVVVMGDGGRILRSDDLAAGFAAVDSGVTCDLRRIVDSGSALLALGEGGLLLASDDGLRWVQRPRPTRAEIVDLLAGQGGGVHALTQRGALLHSADGGRSWRSEPCRLGRPPRCLALTATGRALIGGAGGCVTERTRRAETGAIGR